MLGAGHGASFKVVLWSPVGVAFDDSDTTFQSDAGQNSKSCASFIFFRLKGRASVLVSLDYLVNHTDLFSCVQRESQERSGAVPCDGRWGLGSIFLMVSMGCALELVLGWGDGVVSLECETTRLMLVLEKGK